MAPINPLARRLKAKRHEPRPLLQCLGLVALPAIVQPALPVERLAHDVVQIVALRRPAERALRPAGAGDEGRRVARTILKSTLDTLFTTSITSLTVCPWP
jgi:hypothetical protein